MKRLLVILLILIPVKGVCQRFSVSGSAVLKSYQLYNQSTFDYFKEADGLSKYLYGPKVSIGIGIDLFVFNSLELSGQYAKKTLFENSVPVTTEQYPDGTGQYITEKEEFEDFEAAIALKHYFDINDSFLIGVGPSIGYGLYKRSIVFTSEANTSYNKLTYGVSSTLVYVLTNVVAIRADVDYTIFKPTYELAPGADPSKAGTTDIATFVTDLGGLSSSIGIQFSF
jgi:hypothetical protein